METAMSDQSDRHQFERVARLFVRKLGAAGLNAEKGRTNVHETGGRDAEIATWSVGQPCISVWFDHWLETDDRHYWLGFEGAKGAINKLLENIEKEREEKPAVYNNTRFVNDEGSTLDVVRRHNGFVCEHYGEDNSYLGKYQLTSRPNIERLVDELAKFILKLVHIDQAETIRPSENERIARGRIGQADFRRELVDYWGGCAVTGCTISQALRASHIKPWSRSTVHEKRDPNNGLLLTATIDALFDEHLISFDDHGRMLLTTKIRPKDRKALMLAGRKLSKPLLEKQKRYLRLHRREAERRWNQSLIRA